MPFSELSPAKTHVQNEDPHSGSGGVSQCSLLEIFKTIDGIESPKGGEVAH